MIKLAPSILSADFSNLGNDIKKVEAAGAHYLHVDVMDGNFVPNISIGMPVIKSIGKITSMPLDVHLMIEKPQRYLEDFANVGADIINFHVEACDDIQNSLNKIKSLNKKSALTVKPNTDINTVLKYVEQIDMVLVMSVEPGFGGQKIITETLKKVSDLASYIYKNNLNVEIEIDGGVNIDNVSTVIDVGANVIVVGSSIFGADDITNNTTEFLNIFKKYG